MFARISDDVLIEEYDVAYLTNLSDKIGTYCLVDKDNVYIARPRTHIFTIDYGIFHSNIGDWYIKTEEEKLYRISYDVFWFDGLYKGTVDFLRYLRRENIPFKDIVEYIKTQEI